MTDKESTSTGSVSTTIQNHVALNVEDDEREDVPQQQIQQNEQQSASSSRNNKERSPSLDHDEFDDGLLHRAVADGGRWAYGVIMVEVWVLSHDDTLLSRPEAGWWIDPVYHSQCDNRDCKICRLTDSSMKNYVQPEPLYPGEGLPGVLWAESGRVNMLGDGANRSDSSAMRQRMWSRSFDARRPVPTSPSCFNIFAENNAVSENNAVTWREVQSIADDPDQPFNPRLQVLADIGLGWAAAVPFNFHGQKGIVIYMARASVDMKQLRSSTNEHYLLSASSLIGAAYSMRGPRQQMQYERSQKLDKVLVRVRNKIKAAQRAGGTLQGVVKSKVQKTHSSFGSLSSAASSFLDDTKSSEKCGKGINFARRKATSAIIKSKGGGTMPPPPFDWEQTTWTFVGSFITLLMVCRCNVHLNEQYGSDFTIVLGPFGALVTLLYGLTAAPASQPRSAIAGQTISLTIALGISYADGMSVWMQQSLATALSVAAMAKLGVTHPPAGAAALLFSTGQYDWGNMLFVLVGNIIAIGAATVINNFSDYRHYPTFWGLRSISAIIQRCSSGKKEKKAS